MNNQKSTDATVNARNANKAEARIPGQLYAPNGQRIVAAKDWVPGNALIAETTRNADGTLEIQWAGETVLCWEGQYTETLKGQRVFLDEGANEWLESQLELNA